jgi:formate dehydrogenase maturation protein FdhE
VTQGNGRPQATRAAWSLEQRASRADALAPQSESGREALVFVAGLYRVQAEALGALRGRSLSGVLENDLPLLALDGVRRYAAETGPPGLADEARQGEPGARLLDWWRAGRSGRDSYLARALLRPYGEALAEAGIDPEAGGAERAGCPRCQAPPLIAWRRAEPGESGAQRLLGCGLCGGEWTVNRIYCPACGEEDPYKLAVFQGDRFPAVRLEACDRCRVYVKSIDMTVDARAIPEVDDLASLSMDLWAGEQGYTRLEPSAAGV